MPILQTGDNLAVPLALTTVFDSFNGKLCVIASRYEHVRDHMERLGLSMNNVVFLKSCESVRGLPHDTTVLALRSAFHLTHLHKMLEILYTRSNINFSWSLDSYELANERYPVPEDW
jgi:hypothetical protein